MYLVSALYNLSQPNLAHALIIFLYTGKNTHYLIWTTYLLAPLAYYYQPPSLSYTGDQAFKTPTFFVQVRFFAEQDIEDVYSSGGRSLLASNRVSGNVRVSPMRSKENFDELATKIEAAWYETVKMGLLVLAAFCFVTVNLLTITESR
jgi:hypothetical protein